MSQNVQIEANAQAG